MTEYTVAYLEIRMICSVIKSLIKVYWHFISHHVRQQINRTLKQIEKKVLESAHFSSLSLIRIFNATLVHELIEMLKSNGIERNNAYVDSINIPTYTQS